MGQNHSDTGPPPMAVGMSQNVFNRIQGERRSAEDGRGDETGTRPDAELENPASKIGLKLENPASKIGLKLENPATEAEVNPDNPNGKSSPCEAEKPRRSVSEMYLRTPKRYAESGGGKGYSERWERTANEERAFRETIDKVLESEKRRSFNDVEELLPSMSDSDAQMKRKMCSENFSRVTRCYRENSTRTLLCAEQAAALFSCFRDRDHSGGRKNQQ